MTIKISKVDRSALKFNQGAIVLLTAIAFIFNITWLILLVAVVLLIGTIFPKVGFIKLIYIYAFKRYGFIKADIVEEDNNQHLFAQGLGGVFLLVSFILLEYLNQQFIGWTLSLLVLALAFINLTLNFCAGCFIYYQLNRFGVFSNNISEKQHA